MLKASAVRMEKSFLSRQFRRDLGSETVDTLSAQLTPFRI